MGEGRIPGDHDQLVEAGQLGDDVLGDAVAEISLLRIAAHVVEGQDGDGRSAAGQIVSGRFRLRNRRPAADAEHPDQPLDIF